MINIKNTAILLGIVAVTPALQGCPAVLVAGVGTAAVVADDRRTTGVFVEDQNIELKVAHEISKKYGKTNGVDVRGTSYNRFVLLNGEVPNGDIRSDIEALASGVENVRNVQNEIQVGPPTTTQQKAADSATTSKVKTGLLKAKNVQANHVKVLTRDNVVYLMGLVSAQEADIATEVARTTGGVEKVVRVFEIQQP
ncbi:MAG: BON domain-containing protein [Burkholderiales bacterium]|nr:BON domain-containing protein [Burkholderiales bacterium]